jgi:hypothetical protein
MGRGLRPAPSPELVPHEFDFLELARFLVIAGPPCPMEDRDATVVLVDDRGSLTVGRSDTI